MMNIEIPEQFKDVILKYVEEKDVDEKNIGQLIGCLFYGIVTGKHETEFSFPWGKSESADVRAVEDFFDSVAEAISIGQKYDTVRDGILNHTISPYAKCQDCPIETPCEVDSGAPAKHYCYIAETIYNGTVASPVIDCCCDKAAMEMLFYRVLELICRDRNILAWTKEIIHEAFLHSYDTEEFKKNSIFLIEKLAAPETIRWGTAYVKYDDEK